MNTFKGLATGCFLSLVLWVLIMWAIAALIGEGILYFFAAVGL